MIVNSSWPPIRQSASPSADSANPTNAIGDRTAQAHTRDFAAMVKHGHLPFASSGTATGNETASTLFVVTTAKQAYSVEPCVGDSAASFDARPIVGPVGTTPDGSPAASASISGTKSALGEQAPPQITASPLIGKAWPTTSSATSHQTAQPAALRSSAAMVGHGQRAPDPRNENHLFGSRGNVSPVITGMAENRPTQRTSLPASLPPQTAARGANFAALVAALPQEVRVTVRGMMLEPGERDELAREIRAALAGYGLDHRAIHIISGQGTN